MNVNFYNVTISVDADSAKQAYDKLCNALGADKAIDWTTDTYDAASDRGIIAEGSTSDLFPTEAEAGQAVRP